MNVQNKLGRGLDELLGAALGTSQSSKDSQTMPIDMLEPGAYQPRSHIDSEGLEDLARSIRSHGVILPIIVRKSNTTDRYEIVAGERRWRAAQLAAVYEVPVIVKDISDNEVLAVSLIENLQRQDLNPVDESQALKRLADEFAMTHADIAKSVGMSRASITNKLRLLTLVPEVLELLRTGIIETGHAKVLLALDAADQADAAKVVVTNSLSVRETEHLVKNWGQKKGESSETKTSRDPDVVRMENLLSDKFGTTVTIADRGGKGYLKIRYHNLDELDGILKKFH